MSKELIEQLAQEHGGQRFRLHGDIGYSYQFTEPDLEAFAKACQAAAPIYNVAEALEKAIGAIKKRKQATIYSDESVSGLMCYNEGLDVAIQTIRALIPDTQPITPKEVNNMSIETKDGLVIMNPHIDTDKTVALAIANQEIQTLRAKVASADVLVEALTMLLTTREYKEVNGKDYVYDAMRITAWDMAEKALATYDKLSEVKNDTK